MKGKSALMAGVAAIALVATAQAASAAKQSSDNTSAMPASSDTSGPSNAELQQQIDALQAELQDAEVRQSADHDKLGSLSMPSMGGWWDNTSISGRMYFDMTDIDAKSGGTKSTSNGTGFDIKRFYVSIDHTFNKVFSADITTDFTYDSSVGATQIYIKKAFLQAKLDKAFVVRLGSTDMPWIPFMEGVYGYRYVENTLIDRTKYGNSADWGVHVLGDLADGLIDYQISAIDGAGYKHAFTGTHTQSIDVEGRVNVNYDGFILGVGGYTGKLGKDVEGVSFTRSANRFDAVAAYVSKQIHAGVEYFSASNFNTVTSATTKDHADGYSLFASYKFDPQWGVFGRYDWVQPETTVIATSTKTKVKDNYYNFGISYSPAKIVDFSLAYKHDGADDGTLGTSNGTIGGIPSGDYSEVGIWADFQW